MTALNVSRPCVERLRQRFVSDGIERALNEDPRLRTDGQDQEAQPWVSDVVKRGMRLAVTEGTMKNIFADEQINAAGKTGTAEYCDKYANARNRCIPGNPPAHAWALAFAPYDNPEVVVAACVYDGTEGSTVADPIVRGVLGAYFELKKIDSAQPGCAPGGATAHGNAVTGPGYFV